MVREPRAELGADEHPKADGNGPPHPMMKRPGYNVDQRAGERHHGQGKVGRGCGDVHREMEHVCCVPSASMTLRTTRYGGGCCVAGSRGVSRRRSKNSAARIMHRPKTKSKARRGIYVVVSAPTTAPGIVARAKSTPDL